MNSPLVSVIIVNYNGYKYLHACLSSLEKQSYLNFEIIFVDNGSTDGSIELIENNYIRFVRIIKNPLNYGFAKGNNIGILASKGEYIVTLNNDTKVDFQWLKELVRAAEEDQNIGMCASKIYFAQDYKLIDSVGVCIYPDGTSKQRCWRTYDQGQFDRQEEVLLPSACAALYRRKMLDEVGLFDEDFFAYCEDTDLGLRARLKGWRCIFVPTAVVYHYYSGTAGKYSDFKLFLVERNHCWVAFKIFPVFLLLAFPFYTLKRFVVQALSLFVLKDKTLKGNHLPLIILKAYISAIINTYSVLRKRREIQSNKRLSNAEIYRLLKKYRLDTEQLALK